MNRPLHARDFSESYRPRAVSDRRLAALDLVGAVLVIAMALGPLSAYATFGG